MTSTAGADPHPEASEVSDFSEGLLPVERHAVVARHLAGCAVCSDVLRSLEEIRGLLGTLPGPQRMPADIAGRIDAALAAEALLDATRPDVPRETSPSPSEPSRSEPSSSAPSRSELPSLSSSPSDRVPRETSTGAKGGATGPAGVRGPGDAGGRAGAPAGPGGRADTSRGPGGRGPDGGGPGRRRRRGILAAASALGVLLVGGAVYAATSGGGAASGGVQDQARQQRAGVAATIGDRVHQLLGRSGGSHSAQPVVPETSGHVDTPMLQPNTSGGPGGSSPASPVRLPSCVLNATHRSQPPLAADREVFAGAQSYLVVFPHPQDASRVDAYVVNAACSGTSPGTVLFQGTYPR